MLVYVLNKDGKPLMPCSPRKARILLKENKAKIFKREPFTIQLIGGSSGYKQEINLGVDPGSKFVGISATTDKKELFAGELQLRTDIVSLLSTKRQNRRSRRNRKLRYRKARFLNRRRAKGWLAPSIENKINAHIKLIKIINSILPITKIIVEVASFDIQKIKNPQIENYQYSKGEQSGFSNVREYVLWRDGHKCHGRKNCKNKVLQVHHIESRKTGGNSPSNLITLCKECHEDYHLGKLKIVFKKQKSTRDMAFMGIMRKTLFERLSKLYDNVFETYGYITKYIRIENNIEKSHRADAKCISKNPKAESQEEYYYIKQTRKHNRQIHKHAILKNGIRKMNQTAYITKGFRLFDKVKYFNKEYFVFSRRSSGNFDIRNLKGEKINNGSINCRLLTLVSKRSTFLFEKILEV